MMGRLLQTAASFRTLAAPVAPVTVTGYQFSNTASSLTGAGVNKTLVASGAAAGTWAAQNIAANATATASFFTPTGDPGTSGLSTKIVKVKIDVTTGNSNLIYGARLLRINSSGTVQNEGDFVETASGAAATYTLYPSSTGLGTWASGDQLRVDIRARNISASINQSFTFTYASANSSVHVEWSNSTAKWNYADKHADITLSGSDLIVGKTSAAGYANVRSTVRPGSDLVYGELYYGATSTGSLGLGLANSSAALGALGTTDYFGGDANGITVYLDGSLYQNNVLVGSIAALAVGDYVGIAYRRTTGKAWFRRIRAGTASTWNNSGTDDPVTSTGGLTTGLGTDAFLGASLYDVVDTVTLNAGTSAFAAAAPVGATAWNGASLTTNAVAAFTGSGTLTGSFTAFLTTPATLSGSGALAGAGQVIAQTAASFTGSGGLAGTARAIAQTSSSLAGSGALTGAAAALIPASATLSGSGALAPTAAAFRTGAAALTGSGVLAGAGQITAQTTASLTGTGALASAGQITAQTTATLAGSGALAGTARAIAQTLASLSGSGSFAATARAIAQTVAALTGSGTLNGVSSAIGFTAGAGALTGSGTLAAVGVRIAECAASLSGSGSVSAEATRFQEIAAAFTGSGALAGELIDLGAVEPAPDAMAVVTLGGTFDPDTSALAAVYRSGAALSGTFKPDAIARRGVYRSDDALSGSFDPDAPALRGTA